MPPIAEAAKAAQALDDEIVAYFQEHFGPVRREAIIEIVPTEPRIVVHVIPASAERKHVTLFTTGMSKRAMTVPKGDEEFRYAELFIQLPANWKHTAFHKPAYAWPVAWLRSMAQFPYRVGSWLGAAGTVMANEEPPEPLGPKVPFTCVLLFPETRFTSRDGRTIQLYRMTPLYTEERDLEAKQGTAALMRAFDKHGIGFVVDLKRRNVGKK
jgi:hypothetical protein